MQKCGGIEDTWSLGLGENSFLVPQRSIMARNFFTKRPVRIFFAAFITVWLLQTVIHTKAPDSPYKPTRVIGHVTENAREFFRWLGSWVAVFDIPHALQVLYRELKDILGPLWTQLWAILYALFELASSVFWFLQGYLQTVGKYFGGSEFYIPWLIAGVCIVLPVLVYNFEPRVLAWFAKTSEKKEEEEEEEEEKPETGGRKLRNRRS